MSNTLKAVDWRYEPTSNKTLRRYLKILREKCDLPLPVTVRCDLPLKGDDLGSAELIVKNGKRSFLIRLVPGLPRDTLHQILIHEWAHCLDWREEHPVLTDHSATFGVCWAEVYRRFHGVD